MKKIDKISLIDNVTPFHRAENLSHFLRTEIWIKRDDLLGFALGGNKIRILEYLYAQVLASGSSLVLISGGPQSNYVRLALAVARKLKIKAHLILYGNEPKKVDGNFLLLKLMAAEITFTNSNDRNSPTPICERMASEALAKGEKPFIFPRAGASAVSILGYRDFIEELIPQMNSTQLKFDNLILSCGSCGTFAGIVLGLAQSKYPLKAWGIAVSRTIDESRSRVQTLVSEASQLLEVPNAEGSVNYCIKDDYIGDGYGVRTSASEKVIAEVASKEGIFLDPVFTSKAMWGLFDLLERGEISRKDRTIFVHTGGHPTLFAELGKYST